MRRILNLVAYKFVIYGDDSNSVLCGSTALGDNVKTSVSYLFVHSAPIYRAINIT
jgi:hypothetical protein